MLLSALNDLFETFAFRAFQWAPTLGGECYTCGLTLRSDTTGQCFNGHPPLGVNATKLAERIARRENEEFQWAPTLGGECYGIVYLITPPLCQGVDALLNISPRF